MFMTEWDLQNYHKYQGSQTLRPYWTWINTKWNVRFKSSVVKLVQLVLSVYIFLYAEEYRKSNNKHLLLTFEMQLWHEYQMVRVCDFVLTCCKIWSGSVCCLVKSQIINITHTQTRFKIHSKVKSYYTQLTGELTNYNQFTTSIWV